MLRKFLSTERGAVMPEAALALPLYFGLLFIFQDIVVVGYNWLSMQHAVHEGVRVGILGPIVGNPDSHLRSAEDKVRDQAITLGVYGNQLFRIKDREDLYTAVDLENPEEENVTMSVRACGLPAYTGVGNQGRESVLGEKIFITAKKTIRLTPMTQLLFSLVGQDGYLTIRTESSGFVEPPADEDTVLTDICGGCYGQGNPDTECT